MFLLFQIYFAVLFFAASVRDVTPQRQKVLKLDHQQNNLQRLSNRLDGGTYSYTTQGEISSTSPPFQYFNKEPANNLEEIYRLVRTLQIFGKGSHSKRRRDVPNTSYSRSGAEGGVTVYNPNGKVQPSANQSTPAEDTLMEGTTTKGPAGKVYPPSNHSNPSEDTFRDGSTTKIPAGDAQPPANQSKPAENTLEDNVTVKSPAGGSKSHDNQTKSTQKTLKEDGLLSLALQTGNDFLSKVPGFQKFLPIGEQGQTIQEKYPSTTPSGSTGNTNSTSKKRGFLPQTPSVFGFGFGRR